MFDIAQCFTLIDMTYHVIYRFPIVIFIEMEIIKGKENNINISHEKYKYIVSCFEAGDEWTKRDK